MILVCSIAAAASTRRADFPGNHDHDRRNVDVGTESRKHELRSPDYGERAVSERTAASGRGTRKKRE